MSNPKKIFQGVGEPKPQTAVASSEERLVAQRELSEAVEETEKARKEELERQFRQQLSDFATDESYFSEYDRFTPIGAVAVVKLFNFEPDLKGGLGSTKLYLPSPLTGEYRQQEATVRNRIFPIVKVIKLGIGNWGEENSTIPREALKEGGIYVVPYTDVIGEQWNPDFLHLVNTFAGAGGKQGKLVNTPQGMPQKITNLSQRWGMYEFSMPDQLFVNEEEVKLIYQVPVIKLRSIYQPPIIDESE